MILVETEPPGVDVYVNGVLSMTRPVELPRSDKTFRFRVHAPGYRSHVLELRADRTRSVRVKLERP